MAHQRRYRRRLTPAGPVGKVDWDSPCCCDCGCEAGSPTVTITWDDPGETITFDMDFGTPVERAIVIDHDKGVAFANERRVYECGQVDITGAEMELPEAHGRGRFGTP